MFTGHHRRLVTAAIAIVIGAVVSGAAAANVVLSIRDGRVWLSARQATPRQILAEWERVGLTHVVNADRVNGGPITIELAGVPEQQALDVVLQSVSGFMAVKRPGPMLEASTFDRILILPTSVAPSDSGPARNSPPPFGGATPSPVFPQAQPIMNDPARAGDPGATAGVQRIIGADGQPVPDDQEGAPPPVVASPPYAPPQNPGAPPPDVVGAPPTQAPAASPPASSPVPTAAPGVAVPGTIVQPPAPNQRPQGR